MAAPGTFAAYQQLRPYQGDLAQDAQQQFENQMALRGEKRLEDQIEEQRQAKAQAKKDALRNKMLGQIPKNFDSGSTSLNELQGNIIQQGANRLVDIYDKLGDPSVSETDKLKLQLEAQNIENLPENLKVATGAFQGKIQDYQKGVADGSYFRDPNFENLTQTGFEKYIGGLDNGLPVVGFVDKNRDGVIDIADVVSYDDIQSGLPQFQFQKQYDLDKMAVEAAKGLGTTDVTTDRNFTQRQIKGPNLDSLEVVSTNMFVNPDGTPTDFAKSEIRKRGLTPDQAGLDEVKRVFKERVLANTSTTDKTDIDYGAMNAASRERRLARGEEDKDAVVIGNPVEPSKNTWGKQYDNIDKKTKRSIPVSGKLTLPAIPVTYTDSSGKKVAKNVTDATVENYTYNKDGKLVIDVSFNVDKTTTTTDDGMDKKVTTSKEKRKEQIAVSPETESRIAKRMGLTVKELRDSAENPDAGKETAAERAIRIAQGL